VAVDCCITIAPCGGEKAGKSPVDREERGTKRSIMVDACGITLGVWRPGKPPRLAAFGAYPRVLQTLGGLPEPASVHLDRAYDSKSTTELLESLGLVGVISKKGKPAPLGATKRWVVERTNSRSNAHKELLWCTERAGQVVDFWTAFSNMIIIVGRLIREAWRHCRW
jgi:hypothetical protein